MHTNLSNEVSKLRREVASKSIVNFMRTYLPDHLKYQPSEAHHEIYELLEKALSRRGQRIALAAPRGFGKSTLVSLAYLLYCIAYGHEKFIVVLSATSSQAIQLHEIVRKELETNELLLLDFPELRGKRPSPWTQSEIETPNGVRLLALGRGQHIRGRKFGKHRPTLILVDDVETRQNCENSDMRDKIKSWYFQDILKAGSESTNFFFVGTLVHASCLLSELLDPEKNLLWMKKRYQAIIHEPVRGEMWAQWSQIYNSHEEYNGKRGPESARQFYEANRTVMDEGVVLLWPERYNYYDLRLELENDPIGYYSELQNAPINPKTCLFDIDECHYWDTTWKNLAQFRAAFGDRLEFFGGCDLAVGNDASSGDYTAITVLARDKKENVLYVVEVHANRHKVHETIELILALHQKYNFRQFGIETNGFQVLGAENLAKQSRQRGVHLPITELKNTTNKVARIQRLQPRAKTAMLQFYHHVALMDQVQYFPKGKYDDILDSLEMAVQVAEKPLTCTVSIVGGDGGDDWWGDYSRNLGWRLF